MAKRIVVFDNGTTQSRESLRNPAKVTKLQKPAAPKPPVEKKPASPKPQKKQPEKKKSVSQEQALEIFIKFYLEDAREVSDRALVIMNSEDRTDTDKKYFAEKRDFLEKVIDIVRTRGAAAHGFSSFSEPFFYNEWHRMFALSFSCTMRFSENTPGKRIKVMPIWGKARRFVSTLLLPHYVAVRARRDGFILRSVPAGPNNLALDMNGTMLYLEKQIEAAPDRDDLRELFDMYRNLYRRSGLDVVAYRAAREFTTKNVGTLKYWKNQDTVDYLLSHLNTRAPKAKEQPSPAPSM